MTSTIDSDLPAVPTAAVVPKLSVTLDPKGRLRTTKPQRRVILAEFQRSGLSAAQFAKRSGLKHSTFAVWVQRERRRRAPGRKPPVRLLEAVVSPAPAPSALWVQLPGGAQLELRAANQIPLVIALMRALEKPC